MAKSTLITLFLLFVSVQGFSETSSGARNQASPVEHQVGVEMKHGEKLPLDTMFRNEEGQSVPLGSFFGKGPVVMGLVYYECPSICGLLIPGIFRTLAEMKFKAGKEFSLILASIDPRETPELAKEKKKNFLKRYPVSESNRGVHFLTGDEESIKRLADSVGFRYEYDEKTDQYAHPAMSVVITEKGVISQYHAGVEFGKKEMRLSLVQASGNTIGTPLDHFFLYCYRYDPLAGRYGLVIMNVLRLLGALTLVGIVLGIIALVFWEKRKKKFAEVGV